MIDNTVRKLLNLNRPAYGVGLCFSLGHSTVVFLMAAAAAVIGSWIGPFVTGAYLITVAVVNLFSVWSLARSGQDDHHHGGLLSRLIAPLTRLVGFQWQVFPLEFLIGLGFETASEVALLALAGNAAQQGLNWAAVLSLPLLFAAGVTLSMSSTAP